MLVLYVFVNILYSALISHWESPDTQNDSLEAVAALLLRTIKSVLNENNETYYVLIAD